MAVIQEIIKVEPDGTLSFGNYLAAEKQKVNKFEHGGHQYSVKTYNQATRTEKNGILLFEGVPGVTVHGFSLNENLVSFAAEGAGDTSITLELEAEQSYKISIEGNEVGSMKSNLSGKINFSMDLNENPQKVTIEKL